MFPLAQRHAFCSFIYGTLRGFEESALGRPVHWDTEMILESHTMDQVDRYSAKASLRSVNFLFLAPHAQNVSVIGDFNDWHPNAHPMTRQPDGGWFKCIQLHHGHHRYQFLVDGLPVLDPRAQGVARNAKNEKVSIVAVS